MRTSLPSTLDPRAWNLVAGAALLAAGCNSRPPLRLGPDETGTTAESGDAESDADTQDGDDACVTDADCGYAYSCEGGVCEYWGYQDGSIWYDCYSEGDCGNFEQCVFDGSYGYNGGWCEQVGSGPPACEPGARDIPTIANVAGQPLALRFTDLDDDGQAELVVVTETELQVFEPGADAPLVSARAMPSGDVAAAVAGRFDQEPGEDLVLLVAGEQQVYLSDGAGGFASQAVEAAAIPGVTGLLSGDFDGQDPTDRLAWGSDGAALDRGGGDVVAFEQGPVDDAAAFDLSAPSSTILLGTGATLRLFDASPAWLADVNALADAPAETRKLLAAVISAGQARYMSFGQYYHWSWIEVWEAGTIVPSGQRFHPQVAGQIGVGDLDGDQNDELVVIDTDGQVTLWFDPLGEGACLRAATHGVVGAALGLALGDHDGDGDDELALRFDTGEVVIIDGG